MAEYVMATKANAAVEDIAYTYVHTYIHIQTYMCICRIYVGGWSKSLQPGRQSNQAVLMKPHFKANFVGKNWKQQQKAVIQSDPTATAATMQNYFIHNNKKVQEGRNDTSGLATNKMS